VIRITQMETRGGHPVPEAGPGFALNPQALHLEAKATRQAGESAFLRWMRLIGDMTVAIALDTTGQSIGNFSPKRYRAWVTRNSDFRKFDDALRMTIDCTLETAAALERLLADTESERIVDYGLHRQEAALMTCIVPSHLTDDHLHFLDGAGGGYALAARALKEKLTARGMASASRPDAPTGPHARLWAEHASGPQAARLFHPLPLRRSAPKPRRPWSL
jgi:hypothetical protein